MAAEVVVGVDLAGGVAHHQDALAVELEEEVAAGLRELGDMPGQQPVPAEDPLALLGKDLAGGEVLARQCVLPERRPLLHRRPHSLPSPGNALGIELPSQSMIF